VELNKRSPIYCVTKSAMVCGESVALLVVCCTNNWKVVGSRLAKVVCISVDR